jgi:hypothetical protein
MNPGLNLMTPFAERVGYKMNVQEIVIDIPGQAVITRDNAAVMLPLWLPSTAQGQAARKHERSVRGRLSKEANILHFARCSDRRGEMGLGVWLDRGALGGGQPPGQCHVKLPSR